MWSLDARAVKKRPEAQGRALWGVNVCSRAGGDVEGASGAVSKTFLFLQGPHGPFFRELALVLRAEGSSILKVGFSRADDREWGGVGPYQAFTGRMEQWSDWIARLIAHDTLNGFGNGQQ